MPVNVAPNPTPCLALSVWLELGLIHGLTLVHFSLQPDPLLSMKSHDTTKRIPQKVLTLSQQVDELKPLVA